MAFAGGATTLTNVFVTGNTASLSGDGSASGGGSRIECSMPSQPACTTAPPL